MPSNETHSETTSLRIETTRSNLYSKNTLSLNSAQSPLDEPASALSPHHISYKPYEFKCTTADGSELLISIDSWCSSGSSLNPPCLHYLRLNKTQSIYRDAFQILDLLAAHHIAAPKHFQKQRPISTIDKFVEKVFDKLRNKQIQNSPPMNGSFTKSNNR